MYVDLDNFHRIGNRPSLATSISRLQAQVSSTVLAVVVGLIPVIGIFLLSLFCFNTILAELANDPF